jgi:hypothetical protein
MQAGGLKPLIHKPVVPFDSSVKHSDLLNRGSPSLIQLKNAKIQRPAAQL